VISEFEKLLNDVAVPDGELLERDELPDAVIDVNDVIADLQVAQVRQKGRGERALSIAARAPAVFFEDVSLGVDLKPG
jgi:hypothetical protein